MGVCMSRCGDAQAAGPAPISHRSCSFDNTESLKKFLHLQSALKSENPSPSTSLGVPHSGELFSLPPSDPEYGSSFAVSPSPQTSERAWGFSVDRTTKYRDHDAAAHQQRLIDATARLERLHDGKQSGSRTFSSSEKERQNTSRSRKVRHYQLPLQKLESPRIPLSSTPLTNFLRKVESYVSLIEAPIEATRPVAKAVSSLVSGRRVCDETDSDDLFTVFEANDRSSEDGEARRQRPSTSLHRLVQSASQVSALEDSCAKHSPKCRLRRSPLKSPKNIDLEDPCIESMREESGEEAAAMDMTATVATSKKSPSPVMRRAPSQSRMRALKGFRRRLSRSLDSRESSADFEDLFQSPAAPTFATSRLSNCTITASTQAALIYSRSMTGNAVVLPVTGSIPGMKLEQAVCDEMIEQSWTVEVLDTSTLEDEDQTPTTSAESCLSDLLSMDAFLDEDQSPSTSLASAQSSFRDSPFAVDARSCEDSSECSSESVSPSLRSPCPSETDDFHRITHPESGDFPLFLFKAFHSLLRVLVAERAQAGPRCVGTVAPHEEMGSLEEENNKQCS